MNDNQFELPLFPLDLVLLPHKQIPLHIFEERYKLMINTCLEQETEFGLVWGTDDNFRPFGCAARVAELVNRLPDGRMDILIEGTQRFKMIERFDLHSYISGVVETVSDLEEAIDLDLGNRVQNLYLEALKLSIGWIQEKQESIELGELSYVVAASINLPHADQQTLLENRSINDRLKIVYDILERTLGTMREVKRRTGSNGHLA
ncbi:MAG: LON peptidase substrate-binding domain-containing protein [bacterium]|nr:LON peptidase substrate-binding domain-containing protein [bacterium]